MDIKLKVLLGILGAAFIASAVFGIHLHHVYRGFVASTTSGEPTYPLSVRQSFGEQITASLRANDARVAIVSRAGQKREKLPEGIAFTHSAFWALQDDGSYAVYNLYHGEENRLISSLVTDDPSAFLKLTQEPDAGILIPTLAAQDRLVEYITSARYGEMHQVNYSLISNPFDSRYQNCNEFMLDSLAAALWDMSATQAIKTRLRESLKPSEIKVSWLRRIIGPKVDERLIMSDHGNKVYTATRQTLGQFLESQDALALDYILPLAVDDAED